MLKIPQLPQNCVLGLNYSGMHDSAIAIVSPDGTPLFALSLERISRIKQDGRPPFALFENLPWSRIEKVAISAPKYFLQPENTESKLHPLRLQSPRLAPLVHEAAFLDFLKNVPCEKVFVGHQEAHAASAFWGSGFDEALCLTYDGGMSNDPWFGGLYQCKRQDGILPLDRFSAMHYAKVTSLYTFVTALLGFTPNKHEGKITGLAAYGRPTERCQALLMKWMEKDYFEMEESMRWIFAYEKENLPQLISNRAKMKRFREESSEFNREEMAATVQHLAESHILEILKNARSLGWYSRSICLAGGLFANVKINQRVLESGFERLFVAPSMTDDGTALGAAWYVASSASSFDPKPLSSMFLGPSYGVEEVREIVEKENVTLVNPANSADAIASLLADGAVVAIFQEAMEFGPRALGNRSILAQASESDINRSLNERLNRTEFMPFAPMTLLEDADTCYLGIDKVQHTAEFMTVTVDCTDSMRQSCPAVVHVDGTARPQLVTRNSNPLVYEILSSYKQLTGRLAIVNTSFNIHEEPIICSPEDALRGFFESGLDYLFMKGIGIIPFKGNEMAAIRYMQQKLRMQSNKSLQHTAPNLLMDQELEDCNSNLKEKESEIQQKEQALVQLTQSLVEKEAVIQELSAELESCRSRLLNLNKRDVQ
jgi:carbamoyltransferase